jgi:hypothetical protein
MNSDIGWFIVFTQGQMLFKDIIPIINIPIRRKCPFQTIEPKVVIIEELME